MAMNRYAELLEHIESLRIADTHEHVPLEQDLPREPDILAEWLLRYFSSDLVSAGLPEAALADARGRALGAPEPLGAGGSAAGPSSLRFAAARRRKRRRSLATPA
jgi:hypothetical protein